MIDDVTRPLLGEKLLESLSRRGIEELTPVQSKVLEPQLRDSDLRITSQTGSGKTVAIGFTLRECLEANLSVSPRERLPCVLIVVPTRELAKQVRDELGWLYAPYGLRLACVTGGASYSEERRSLAMAPSIVVGTPGRLVDHIKRGSVNTSALHTVVLDEADRMLDLGFAEDLETIFTACGSRKRTHLVSATLAPEVLKLATKFQSNPRTVQGTRPGETHADIEHLVHLVPSHRRIDALINVLLAQPDERTLVFVRTRAEVAGIAEELQGAGFRVAALSGDMEQPARDRALLAFREDRVRVLVATDVAARGIDIQGMTRVIHLEPPTDPDSYTHRSGRTGRAGQKGASILFVAPERQQFARRILAQAQVRAKLMPLPDLESLRRAADERTRVRLADALEKSALEPRRQWIAEQLLLEQDPVRVVAMLIARTEGISPEPRHIPDYVPPAANSRERRPPMPSGKRSAPWRDARENGDRGFARNDGYRPATQAKGRATELPPGYKTPKASQGLISKSFQGRAPKPSQVRAATGPSGLGATQKPTFRDVPQSAGWRP